MYEQIELLTLKLGNNLSCLLPHDDKHQLIRLIERNTALGIRTVLKGSACQLWRSTVASTVQSTVASTVVNAELTRPNR